MMSKYPVLTKFREDVEKIEYRDLWVAALIGGMKNSLGVYESNSVEIESLFPKDLITLLSAGIEIVEGQEGEDLNQSRREMLLTALSMIYYDLLRFVTMPE
jgi:hypothetical protein